MIHMQNTKTVIVIKPQSVGTDALTGNFDTLGYNHARVIYTGTTAAAGALPAVLKLQQGDTTSAFTDVTGAVGGTDATGGFTIPTPNTDAGQNVIFDVNLNGKKRYLQTALTGTATARVSSVIAILSRAAVTPDTDSEAGAAEIVYV